MKNTLININQFQTLSDMVNAIDNLYKKKISLLPLFDPNVTKKWSVLQKKVFAKVFYHLRGHFHDFLWQMGNFAPNLEDKNIILKNISEEFGESRVSHELLYINFAKALHVDILEEIISEQYYMDFARKFNKGHLSWLLKRSWNEKLAAFSAYEHLDNIDYPQLLDLATSFEIPEDALLFFKVHTFVQHYEATELSLKKIWEADQDSIVNGFNFIYTHQLNMWHNLYITVDKFAKSKSRETSLSAN